MAWSFVGTPTITYTNFISGKAYTNTSGRPLCINASVQLTMASVSGASEIAVYVDATGGTTWTKTNLITLGTIVGTLADSYNMELISFVPTGGSYIITNTSRGALNSATTISSTMSPYFITY